MKTFLFLSKKRKQWIFHNTYFIMFLIFLTDTQTTKSGLWNLFRFDLLKSSLLDKLIFYCHISTHEFLLQDSLKI